jgi:UDP-GlcNAc:undecaprenyl-phosphate GlcNAc-1-phosphate transferase
MVYLKYGLIFFSALLLSIGLVPVCAYFSKKLGILDQPDDKLKKHARAVPYFGGVAIYLAFFITLVIYQLHTFHTLKGITGIILAGSLAFALGLADDIKKLSIPFKFCVQILAAIILVIFGIKIQFMSSEILNIAVTILWVVGITNAFNLLDIMDGLSSGVAIIASLTFFVLGLDAGKLFSPLAALALAGSCLGFLYYNYAPAKIFMGDAGSLFIGIMLAALSLTESYTYKNNLAVLTPVFILGIPIFDTFFVMWMRAKQGKPVYFGSPDHFPLRMKRSGMTVRQVVTAIYFAAAAFAVVAYTGTKISLLRAGIMYTLVCMFSMLAALKLSRMR